MNSSVDQFEDILAMIRGIYEDSRLGYDLLSQKILEWQEQMRTKIPPEHLESIDLDKMPFIYGRGDEVTADEFQQRAISFGMLKARNSNSGHNLQFVANTCIVMLYQYWEDYFRKAIADELDVPKNNIKADIMGDIRIIRQSIIHNHSIATSKVSKCTILDCLAAGEPIAFTDEQFYSLLDHVQQLISYVREAIRARYA